MQSDRSKKLKLLFRHDGFGIEKHLVSGPRQRCDERRHFKMLVKVPMAAASGNVVCWRFGELGFFCVNCSQGDE